MHMSLWDGNPHIIPSVSVFSFGKRLLGAEKAGAWHYGKCKALQGVYADAMHGYVSKEDTHCAGNTENRTAGARAFVKGEWYDNDKGTS